MDKIIAPLEIKVNLWGQTIGRLKWDKEKRVSIFQFTQEYHDAPYNLMPTNFTKPKGAFYGEQGDLYRGLPPFIADSLPDNWGSIVFTKWLKENHIQNYESNPLLILSYIGKRGMGALEFVPEYKDEIEAEFNIESLEALANKIYNERLNAVLSEDEKTDLQNLTKLGTPPGGAHPKTLLAINNDGTFRSGQPLLGKEYKQFLLKFKEDINYPSAELEKIYSIMAKEAGIIMTDCDIFKINGKNHFITERFDRYKGMKIMSQTMAAIIPKARDYRNLFFLTSSLKLNEVKKDELFRRMCFNIVAGVTDDHNKNFSFLMYPDGTWDLSPAYDLTFTANIWKDPDADIHCLGVNEQKCLFKKENLLQFGEDFSINNPEKQLKQVCEAVSLFPELCEKYGIEPSIRDNIKNALNRIFPDRKNLVKVKPNPEISSFSKEDDKDLRRLAEHFKIEPETIILVQPITNSKKEITGKLYHFSFNGKNKSCVTDTITGDVCICNGLAKPGNFHKFHPWKTLNGKAAVCSPTRVVDAIHKFSLGPHK